MSVQDTRLGALFCDGTYKVKSTANLAPGIFQHQYERAAELSKLFDNDIKDRSDSRALCAAKLGRALKYLSAWDVISTAVLEESAFTSLPHGRLCRP